MLGPHHRDRHIDTPEGIHHEYSPSFVRLRGHRRGRSPTPPRAAGVASAKAAKGCHKTHTCHSGGRTGSGTGGVPAPITVQIDPNPLVETSESLVAAVIQVETSPSFAGDAVNISSSQLQTSCTLGGTLFANLQGVVAPPTLHESAGSIQAILDDDGNATVVVQGVDCAPGPSVFEADLMVAPFYTALTTLNALPPVVTPPGITGYPTSSGRVTGGEVETGDTAASGDSNVIAIFYVETDPVYAEQKAEISSSQLEGRCIRGWGWYGAEGTQAFGPGVNTGPRATALIDNDGNAVFAFFGTSCAAGDSQVIADVLAGSHPTYVTTFTVLPPAPTI